MQTKKVLIIRFSSFGDVLQCLSVPSAILRQWPKAEIQWVTREDFSELIQGHPAVSKVWILKRSDGFGGLRLLASELKAEGFTHVYDAHNNLRSRILCWFLVGVMGWRIWLGRIQFLRRPIYRLRRFFLFKFRMNFFEKPFNGQRDLLRPLRRWGLAIEAPPPPQLFLNENAKASVTSLLGVMVEKPYIALAPSAAFVLKRWPVANWKSLILSNGELRFVILGGPADTFLQEIAEVAPDRVLNLAGRLSLAESAEVVQRSTALVSNDTGLLHVAEQLGKPCIALMGPAPFGFPSRPLTRILELDLDCRPCSKHGQGPCVNPEYQKCLAGIPAHQVSKELNEILDLHAGRFKVSERSN